MKNVLCLVIDRLHAGFIGAYGNTWITTPHLNDLAADGFVLDRAMIDSPRLEILYRSYWRGLHAMAPDETPTSASLPETLTVAGYHTALWTDDRAVGEAPLAGGFREREFLDFPAPETVAESIEDTQLAQFMAAVAERLPDLPEPFCCWIHISSLGRAWDAPLDFRNQYADEDDPPPPKFCVPPRLILPAEFDPDELLGLAHAYAGQVTLLDLCLGSLLDPFNDGPRGERTLVALLSARGLPLGEHGRVGDFSDAGLQADEPLYGELTHVPWIVRSPEQGTKGDRSQALVQPPDLFATIAQWTGLSAATALNPAGRGRSLMPLMTGEVESIRDRACIASADHERGIVTPAWYLRYREVGDAKGAADDSHAELFVKPDDWFEANEVAGRCPEVVAEMQTALREFVQACQAAETTQLTPLPENLIRGQE